MRFPPHTDRRLREGVPPILELKNSMQNGSIAPPLTLFAGVTIGMDVGRET